MEEEILKFNNNDQLELNKIFQFDKGFQVNYIFRNFVKI